MTEVKAWIQQVTIPTYQAGKPEKNPMFLEKRVYQGSSGVVYPHPVIEHIADEKVMQDYTAVFLENEYLKIMILPELGGRIQRAYDKVKGRDFIYYNQVIKPALVGLAGPWISGGIEFNWPQHHRPSTFSPVDFTIRQNADGSSTVLVNEIELMFRTRGTAGFTLYPGKAYLEITGRLFNRTPFPQTFLWWANPAVKVNEHYQSVFPPDVYAVFDHGKRDVSDFPIATGTYYKVNYAPGTDISRYANIPVPTSYMAIRSEYDFMGCYENDTQAGMLHVANHHISPGKKQWTWGNGDFGHAWDRNLTDEDGPYIELMTGVFTDNQPDFSWLQPNEEKTFEQYFMPYTRIGVVKNATKEAMLNMEWEQGQLRVRVYATGVYENAVIRITKSDVVVREFVTRLSPADVFDEAFDAGLPGSPEAWQITVQDAEGRLLVSWRPEANVQKEIPPAATAARPPAEIEQVEELYINGQHLEQYRHATFNPIDYYQEGLRRSPGDIRCNNAMGLLLLRRGQFEKAEPYFRTAIRTLTSRNPNPYDGEPYYNLGWSLKLQGRLEEAFEAFYKATWNDAWQHSGFLQLSRIAAAQQHYAEALTLAERSLLRNNHSSTTRHLKTALLRKLDRHTEAQALIKESLSIDPFNFGCLFEAWLIDRTPQSLAALKGLMRDAVQNYLEIALDYAQAGLYTDATLLLELYGDDRTTQAILVGYYKAWLAAQDGHLEEAKTLYRLAATANPDGCFPNKIEEVLILKKAIALNPTDARARYYLGNLWYDKRQYPEAITCWEEAVPLDPTFPTVYRNLALAYYNKLGKKEQARQFLEKAFALDTTDARVLMELDQLYKSLGRSFAERLQLLEAHLPLVNSRDDLYLERVTLYNNLGQYSTARQLLTAHIFHPWEGGEGKVVGQFLRCHIGLGRQAIEKGAWQEAIDLLLATAIYPHNLGEGKLYGAQENDVDYWLGCAYMGLGNTAEALALFRKATMGISEPAQAIYYNDPQPDNIIYQALAWLRLNEPEKAAAIFSRFIEFGRLHRNDRIDIDYFAVSLPDMLVFDQDINLRNTVHCTYLIGLGYLGLHEEAKGRSYLQQVLEIDPNHAGAANWLQLTPVIAQALKQDVSC
ncbi:DUF5107 domain-containing protein [Puia dinghuensis]|uniref:DUF5107 domain-containing protein n=1 Tax=Puia dinghuensis TaxID=1792502 RepID=A0A8J2XT99_9BACT|nr:DUF5107 domain-containing protein [Puia dinghuensis]GGB02385.1 hypothetical protein GCM10011511_27050 [Puia dinghuensis]